MGRRGNLPPVSDGGEDVKYLSIDIETYSEADLSRTGVYRYAEDPSFEIMLFGYSVDGGEVNVVDLAQGERIPAEVLYALTDDSVTKTAFNANFERVCLSRYLSDLGIELDPSVDRNSHSCEPVRFLSPRSWRCTMIWSAYLGLPLSLAGVGSVLGLEKQKLDTGGDLVRYFCRPCVPTQANGQRTRNFPGHAPDRWEAFIAYNRRDVETEMEIQRRLANYPVPDEVWDQYCIDQEINDRGILIDMPLVESAIRMDEASHEELTEKMKELTQLDNPSSVAQMKRWLMENGLEVESLGKKQVAALLKGAPSPLREVLSLRQQVARSSVKKYFAMQSAACADCRARGMFQFYGANRTGRFSGRLIQLQNLPQNHLADLEAARSLVRSGDYDGVKELFGDVPDTLSQLIRTAFVPSEGKLFYVADFSAIEARVIAWLAGERWRMNLFKNGGDIYCGSASQMFGVPVEKHGVNGHLRQKGKIAELALGYGGSAGALKAMGALDMGLSEEELLPLVQAWREANPNIVCFWWDVDTAAMAAVTEKTTTETHGIRFSYRSGMLFVTLPSGRDLAYVKPAIGENKFGSQSLTYLGVGSTKKWERLETYGPKLTENITQAVARDLLCNAMTRLRNCSIVAHVHDELIIEGDPSMSLEALCEQMSRTPPWAEGLILRADGYVTPFYRKD